MRSFFHYSSLIFAFCWVLLRCQSNFSAFGRGERGREGGREGGGEMVAPEAARNGRPKRCPKLGASLPEVVPKNVVHDSVREKLGCPKLGTSLPDLFCVRGRFCQLLGQLGRHFGRSCQRSVPRLRCKHILHDHDDELRKVPQCQDRLSRNQEQLQAQRTATGCRFRTTATITEYRCSCCTLSMSFRSRPTLQSFLFSVCHICQRSWERRGLHPVSVHGSL